MTKNMQSLFKGFVLTKNKKCIERFKDRTDLKTYDEVQPFPEFAGILADDTALVDIDNLEQSEIAMDIIEDKQIDCLVNQTTRGKHIFGLNDGSFTKCQTGVRLACGLRADVKIGSHNSYAILKYNGEERFTEWDSDEYKPLPKWLTPVNAQFDFLDMEEGDGRDSALYSYILVLQSNGFSKEEVKECLHIINDYILKDKMSDADMERILRDEAFAKPIFFSKNVFLFDKFAVYLKSQHHIKRINNQLHIYNDGIYVSGYAEIESVMIHHIPQLSKQRRNEVLSYLEVLIRENTPVSEPTLIAFRNGVYDINTNTLHQFSPDYIITNKIPWDFNESAYSEKCDRVLDNLTCNDDDVRMLLEEMVGYTMFRRNELGKAFILTGAGKNGKSTFLNMIKRMLGFNNLSVLDMKKLNDRFSTVMLFGKLANIGDDISEEFIADSSDFKKITTGEMIDAEQKGQPKFQFEPYCKLLFSANSIPRIGKGRDSGAIMRRLVIIPFNARFDKTSDDFDAYIGDELKSQLSMEYLIKVGIEGLKRVLATQEFTICEAVQKELEEFEETNNPILGFFKENDVKDIDGHATKDVYLRYQKYCFENGLQDISAGEFSKQIKKYYGMGITVRRINGNPCRVFAKGA